MRACVCLCVCVCFWTWSPKASVQTLLLKNTAAAFRAADWVPLQLEILDTLAHGTLLRMGAVLLLHNFADVFKLHALAALWGIAECIAGGSGSVGHLSDHA